jgi:hypothetical protein
MLEIKLSFSTIAAALEALERLQDPVVLTEADAVADLNGEPRPDNPGPKAAKAAKLVATPPIVATVPTAAPAPAAPPAPVTYEKSGIPEKIAAAVSPTGGKRAEVIALLARFGAKKGGELKPADFAKFTHEIDTLMMA